MAPVAPVAAPTPCPGAVGFNPRWEETLSFQLRAPELALVRFVVEDYDSTSCNDFVGQFTLPLASMREGGCVPPPLPPGTGMGPLPPAQPPSLSPGYRHIHLLSKDGASLSPATLFVHVRCKSL